MGFIKSVFLSVVVLLAVVVHAQDQPYVDYWDNANTIKRSEGTYTNVLENGEWKYYYPDGVLKEKSNYKFGRLDGEVVTYYFNGKVKEEGFFVWDRQDSLFTGYYLSGNKKEQGSYNDGFKTGLWKYWYADGSPKMEEKYTGRDAVELLNFWNEDGEQLVKNGTGKLVEYYETGRLKTRESYNNGLMTGKSETWYTDGTLRTEGYYDNGKKDSVWTYYLQSGGKYKTTTFDQDSLSGPYKE